MSDREGMLEAVRERQRLSSRHIVAVGAGTLAVLGLSMLALWATYAGAGRPIQPRSATPFPGPALQAHPTADLDRLLQDQTKALHGYAWVDRAHGIVQVPIEQAMHIVAARGDKAYDPPAAPTP